MRKAVVLLSGGLDSTTTLAIARSEGFNVYALSFRYGQRNQAELSAARRVASHYEVTEHIVLDADLGAIGGSALTADIKVPKDRGLDDIGTGIPVTYVPARNTIFLSYALAWAEVIGAHDIFIGVNALDSSGYPDCRPEFIEAFQRLANLATKAGAEGQRFTIHAPLVNLSKSGIIDAGLDLGVDYGITMTCYDPDSDGRGCGRCDACILRLGAFRECGIEDPAPYVEDSN